MLETEYVVVILLNLTLFTIAYVQFKKSIKIRNEMENKETMKNQQIKGGRKLNV